MVLQQIFQSEQVWSATARAVEICIELSSSTADGLRNEDNVPRTTRIARIAWMAVNIQEAVLQLMQNFETVCEWN